MLRLSDRLARLSVLDRLYLFVEALVYGGVMRCEEDYAMEASAVGFSSVASFDFRIFHVLEFMRRSFALLT